MALVLGLSLLAGVLRGLVSEVMALAGWFAAWLLAQAWGLDVAAALRVGDPGSPVARLAGLVITFMAVLLVWRLLTWLLRQVIQASPLAPLDRLLGALFGVVRGVLVLLVLVMVFGLTPLARQPVWQQSRGVLWLGQLHAVLSPWLPGDWGPVLAPSSRSGNS
jgi:membrane protein required for colicin V production